MYEGVLGGYFRLERKGARRDGIGEWLFHRKGDVIGVPFFSGAFKWSWWNYPHLTFANISYANNKSSGLNLQSN